MAIDVVLAIGMLYSFYFATMALRQLMKSHANHLAASSHDTLPVQIDGSLLFASRRCTCQALQTSLRGSCSEAYGRSAAAVKAAWGWLAGTKECLRAGFPYPGGRS